MIINFTQPVFSNFLVQIIAWLVQICSSIALGIVLFTLLLKLITLPFDYFSRASMRRNSVKMEQMRPELEKLQKQYADNKELYNQKMMALYKKNGYSMFGSCLPTILTLVIFIVAINAFTNYSQYQNKMYFYNMSNSYNNVVYAGFELDDNYIKINEKNIIEFNEAALYEKAEEGKIGTKTAEGEDFDIFVSKEGENLIVYTENGYAQVKIPFKVKDGNVIFSENGVDFNREFSLITGRVSYLSENGGSLLSEKNNFLKIKVGEKELNFKEYNDSAADDKKMTELQFITDIQQEKSAETYREEAEGSKFLWVKNIWITDSPLKHPVESDWELFNTTHEYSKQQPDAYNIGAEGYSNLIAKLDKEKTEPNGYFILVILTAGVSLLSQIVMSKTQKAQMELQTVDGQGAQTQKMMTWMMPIMMAIFAFMYTAAFSIYIILSSLMSLGLTYLINFIVDRKIKKEEKTGEKKLRGRVYTPKEEPKKPEKKEEKKPKKDDKFAHESGGDFLTGKKKNKIKYKK